MRVGHYLAAQPMAGGYVQSGDAMRWPERTAPDDASVRLALLGRFEITGPNGPIELASRKLCGLLAVLACTAPVPQPRQKLMALLWGAHLEPQARQSLRKALSMLRQAVPERAIQAIDDGVILRRSVVECDLWRFEALVADGSHDALSAAVSLYRDEFVHDLAIREEAWSDWLAAQRERLQRLAIDAMMRLGEFELAQGRPLVALDLAKRAVEIESLREDAHRLIIRGLAASGRRAEALKHYETLSEQLERELGVTPDMLSAALVADLRSVPRDGNGSVLSETASLRTQTGGFSSASHGPHESSALAPSPAAIQVERRPLTVLAGQILGLPDLSADADPEEVYALTRCAYEVCRQAANRHGGVADELVGDRVLVYFGYPEAREDDAERALRVGHAILSSLSQYTGPQGGFRARIGVAHGVVMVSARTGERILVTGAAVNQALRLCDAAPVDQVLVSEGTRRLARQHFDYVEIGARGNGELTQQPPIWRVLESAETDTASVTAYGDLSRLAGRRRELALLRRCWRLACAGRGQVVLLTGEPGIGKSRLCTELERSIAERSHTILRFRGSAQQSEASFLALISELEASLRATTQGGQSSRPRPSASALSRIGFEEADAPAIVDLVSSTVESRGNLAPFTPHKRKQQIFAALLRRIERLAEQHPLLVLVEDAQWIDPTSIEFLTLLIERTPPQRLLMLAAARPEFGPPWPDHAHVSKLSVPRLSPDEARMLCFEIAHGIPLPAQVAEQILTRSDGVPLFVEELTKAAVERGTERQQEAQVTIAPTTIHIPVSLHASLIERLDRLGPGREIAQIGSVIGREFDHALLQRVAGMGDRELMAGLDRLVASGLAFRRGLRAEATYVFKHALVRDAAYGMFVRARRQALHAGVARALEQALQEEAEAQPELLAYHYREAGEARKAADYLLKAGERALMRSALTEALAQITQALELLGQASDDEGRWRLELRLQIALGRALTAKRGYTAPETRQAYVRARALCDQIDDQSLAPLIIFGHWLTTWTAADYHAALKQALELQRWGKRENEQASVGIGYLLAGVTMTLMGTPRTALQQLDRALEINRFVLPGRQSFVSSGADGSMTALTYKHYCLWLMGRLSEADATLQRVLANSSDLIISSPLAQTHLCRIYALDGDTEQTAAVAERLVRLASQQGSSYFVAMGRIYRGWALAHCGGQAEGIAMIVDGLAELRMLGAICALPRYLALLAESCGAAGDDAGAMLAVDEAFAAMRATGERVWEAELHRLKARSLLRTGASVGEVEVQFAQALATARSQGARMLELRAAVDFARFLTADGRSQKGRSVLVPVCAWFHEHGENLEVQIAREILQSIGG